LLRRVGKHRAGLIPRLAFLTAQVLLWKGLQIQFVSTKEIKRGIREVFFPLVVFALCNVVPVGG
jgi:hypothetical protein